MSTHHLYIANPPDHALTQLDAFGRCTGLGSDARSVLRECFALAWDDGFAEVGITSLARDVGMTNGAAHAVLRELAGRGMIELQEVITGTVVVRPLLLSSDVGARAGIGWWQRLELDYES
ncbi:MAG TPA: hypothetical protein VID19_11795 [Candidatus Eremiobacteraceae bacterium]|jgi:hypothetical protein